MEKPRLVTDCDDVAFPFVDQFISYLNNERGMTLKREDFKSYNLQKILNQKYFWQTLKTLKDFYNSPYFREAKPIKGVFDVFSNLGKYYSLPMVTSRPRILRKETEKFISLLPPVIDSLHFSKNNTRYYNGSWKTKAKICKNLGADLILEDSVEYAMQCAEKGIQAILINNPWNQTNRDHPLIKRVDNIFQVQDYALSLVKA
ncbi:hypothetical protein J4465_03355 [Candidatus Pacearchaeota archaeon]|nr:hypothetical protein [Candidatus Pacearchaeota archaeon]